MRIIGYFHLFPPEHNAGSETTVHAALRAMVNRGHQVRVVCDRSKTAPYNIDGIEVVRPPRRGLQSWMTHFVKDADLLITHLDLTSQAMQLALDAHKPLVHFVHNSAQLKYWHVNTLKCQLAVFNSDWIAKAEKWPGAQITIHPVVEPEYYQCERGDSITLVNPTSGKGAKTFYDLARCMPDRSFLTAQGGYGIQVSCPQRSYGYVEHTFYDDTGAEKPCLGLPNVTHLKNDPDIRNVLRKTRVLLMPSDYESYGRVGIEAACAGIPTIAHPTPGLLEAFGDSAIFCDRNESTEWFTEVDRLFRDDVYYRKRSDAALALANSLTPESEFDRLEDALLVTVSNWQRKEEDKQMKMWTSDRRLYYDKNHNITTNRAEAVSLCCGIGGRIPEEQAIAAGLLSRPAQEVTPGFNSKELSEPEAKAVVQPQENKAIEAPAENKAVEKPRRGRKKKVA